MYLNVSADETIEVQIFKLEDLYYTKVQGENVIEWEIVSKGDSGKADYRLVVEVPAQAIKINDSDVPENLAQTLEAIYTYSPFEG